MTMTFLQHKGPNAAVNSSSGAVVVRQEEAGEPSIGVVQRRKPIVYRLDPPAHHLGYVVVKHTSDADNAAGKGALRLIRHLKVRRNVRKAAGKVKGWIKECKHSAWQKRMSKEHRLFTKEFTDIGPLQQDLVEAEGKNTCRVGNTKLDIKLGNGGFGQVYTASKSPNVAVKVLRKDEIRNKKELRKVNLEIGLLRRHGHHQNVTGFVKVLHGRRCIYVCMERATVSLGALLDSSSNVWKVQNNAKQVVMKGVLEGLKYLHSVGVAHRDVKCDNILISADALDPWWNLRPGRRLSAGCVRLADFGLSAVSKSYGIENTTHRDHDIVLSFRKVVGTVRYMAPEMSLYDEFEARATDMWSCGVVLLEMAGRYCTRGLDAVSRLLDQQRLPEYERALKAFLIRSADNVPSSSTRLLRHHLLFHRLLTLDPEKRVTAAEALNHPWIHYG